MSRIRLTIDELALKGFEGADGRALVHGIRSELARVLSDPLTRADWARSHRMPVLRLGPMPVEMVRASLMGTRLPKDFRPSWKFFGEGVN